jgi:hypothetical protein
MSESPVGLLPDGPMRLDVQGGRVYSTEIQTAIYGDEMRRKRTPVTRRRWAGSTLPLDEAGRKQLRDFFDANYGRWGSFYAYVTLPETLTAFPLGTVAGTTLVVPMKGVWFAGTWLTGTTPITATYTNVKVAGVSHAPSAITANVGSHGEDQLTWSGAQAGAVTADIATGRERVVARFDMDEMTWAIFSAAKGLYVIKLALQELIAA